MGRAYLYVSLVCRMPLIHNRSKQPSHKQNNLLYLQKLASVAILDTLSKTASTGGFVHQFQGGSMSDCICCKNHLRMLLR
jgi:hypothetical protein